MILFSSCLTGEPCRYDGTSCHRQQLVEEAGLRIMHLCPEILAGLDVPRTPCEICGGSGEDVLTGEARIIDQEGADITERLLRGAQIALDICIANGVTLAYLKGRSPSCGCGTIYDGSFTSVMQSGNGIFAALLLQNGIRVVEVE